MELLTPLQAEALIELKKMNLKEFEWQSFKKDVHSITINDTEGLPEPPACIKHFTNLRSLYLIHNQFSTFPKWICTLSNLTELSYADNTITELPPCLGKLNKIRGLTLANNPLKSLPPSLLELRQLRNLDIANLKKSALEEWLGGLTSLKLLDISNYNLGYLPRWIEQLENLERLICDRNNLKTLPAWIVNLKKLKSIRLFHQKINIDPGLIATLFDRGCRIDVHYASKETTELIKKARQKMAKRERMERQTTESTCSIPLIEPKLFAFLKNERTMDEILHHMEPARVTEENEVRFLMVKLKNEGKISCSERDGKKYYYNPHKD